MFFGRSSLFQVREDREVDDSERTVAAGGRLQPTKSSPILGVMTMLPALSPTQTVSSSDDGREASRRRTEPFFDPRADPVTEKAVR